MSRNNDVNITININGDTHTLRAAREDVNALGRSLSNTDTIANALRSSFGKIAASVASIGALAIGVKQLATSGIEANRSFENLKIQLTGLIAANSSNVSILGKTLDAHTKWNMSMKESEGILKKLNETNAKTKFTLEEITSAFNMFYATSAGQGSRAKAVQAMDSIALAAQAVGKNLGDLTPMMDSLATGTVVAASEMGSFMKIVGLTNEELKKANQDGKVYDYIIEKLAKFKELSGEAAKGYEVALGSLKNELTELSRELTKPMFDTLTTGIATFSNFIKENKATIIEWAGYIVTAGKHLGILAGSFVAAKIGAAALNVVLGISRGVLAIFASSLTATLTLTSALGAGIAALKAAFKTFLPTAVIFGAVEAFIALKDRMDGARASGEKLNYILNVTNEELSKLTKNQLEFRLVEIRRELDATKKEASGLQDKIANGFTFMTKDALVENRAKLDELQNNILDLSAAYGEVQDVLNGRGKGASASPATTDSLLQNQIDALSTTLDKASEKAKNVTTLGRLKSELTEIDGLVKKLQGRITDPEKEKKRLDTLEALQVMREKTAKQIAEFNKQDIKNLGDANSAYREISRIGMSEYEKKLDDIDQKYKKWLDSGVDAKTALAAKQKLIDEENKEHTQKILSAQSEIYKSYYEKIGDYAKVWKYEKTELSKKLKEAGISGKEFDAIIVDSEISYKQSAEEKEKSKLVKRINEELKLEDRKTDLAKRRAELLYDETAKRGELIRIEHEHTLTQYEAMLKKGEMSEEYYAQAIALEQRLYEKQLFNASNWGQITSDTISTLQSAMGSFLDYSSEKFMKFGDLAQSVLQSLANSLMKMLVIQPIANALAQGAQGLFGGSGGGVHSRGAMSAAAAVPSAKGNVFSSPDLHSYANSIVNKPTYFKFASGGVPRLGVMGEKNGGSYEAIIPLTRTSNGDLGVRAQVPSTPSNMKIEVINQTNENVKVANVSTRQNMEEQVISIVITAIQNNKMGMRDILGSR